MRLSIPILAEALGDESAEYSSARTSALTLARARLLDVCAERDAPLDEKTLYVCAPDEARQRAGLVLPCSLAVATDEAADAAALAAELSAVSQGACDILVVREPSKTALLQELVDIFEHYADWDAHLLDTIARRAPVQELLDVIAEEQTNPLALFDEASVLIAYAGALPDDLQGTIWEDVLEQGLSPASYYTTQERATFARRMHDSDEPVVVRPDRLPSHENLSLRIMVEGEFFGTLAMVSITEEFRPGQMMLLMHARDRIQQMYTASLAGQRHKSQLNHCLRMLLSGGDVEPRVVTYHLRKRGWSPDDAYQLALMPFSADVDPAFAEPMLEQVRTAIPGALVIFHEGFVVIVAHAEPRGPDAEKDFLSRLDSVRDHGAPCALSDPFPFMRARDAYRQARITITEAETSGRNGLVSYSDVFEQHLLRIVEQGSSLGVVCHPVVLRLADAPDAREQLGCLVAYLECGLNIAAAARSLYMHRSTLQYRLERLQETQGLDLESTDAAERYRLLASCRLMLAQLQIDEQLSD